jgi:hypothetical protein
MRFPLILNLPSYNFFLCDTLHIFLTDCKVARTGKWVTNGLSTIHTNNSGKISKKLLYLLAEMMIFAEL